MLSITSIFLGIIALAAAVCAFVFFRLYKREKKVSKLASGTSPSTINAINALEAARRPDEAFFIRMVKSLKSPLTLVSGPLEQLESRGTLSPEDARLMNVMKNGVTRMERIVSQLSDFSQPDFSGLRLCLNHSYPVCEKIRQDMGYFRSNAELLGIKVDE